MSICSLPLFLGCFVAALGTASQAPTAAPTNHQEPVAASPADPLAISFEVVSRMPSRPHLKTRSRLQADLVQAALDSGRPTDAVRWADEIQNWRRGLALAHVAVHQAQEGNAEALRAALTAAERAEAKIVDPIDQGWRRDRVRVRIAEAYALTGDHAKAAQIQAITTPAESGRLAPLAARIVVAKDPEKGLATLESIARTGDLEQVRYAVLAMGELYGKALRAPQGDGTQLDPADVEQRIRGSWGELPIGPRIDILERLVELEIEAGDGARAARLAKEISCFVTDNRWNPEEDIALRARAAGLLYRAGEREPARKLAEGALALYGTSRGRIFDVFRGDALRPLAESFVILGDHAKATTIYEQALAEAMQNPNSRPRAEDLAETAISAATAPKYAMPESLRQAFAESAAKVGAPW